MLERSPSDRLLEFPQQWIQLELPQIESSNHSDNQHSDTHDTDTNDTPKLPESYIEAAVAYEHGVISQDVFNNFSPEPPKPFLSVAAAHFGYRARKIGNNFRENAAIIAESVAGRIPGSTDIFVHRNSGTPTTE